MSTQTGQATHPERQSPTQGDAITNTQEQEQVTHPQEQPSEQEGGIVMPRPQPRWWQHRWFAVILALLIFLLLVGGLGFFLVRLQAGAGQVLSLASITTRHFSVSAHPQIIVNNDTGAIHVNEASTGKDVAIQATRWSDTGGTAGDIQVRYQQSSDGNTITASIERVNPPGTNPSGYVDFDVTIPGNADLILTTNTGSIAVTGITGQMLLTSSTGSITVQRSRLTGNAGLMTNTGSIIFQGTIDPHGTYQFLTDSGPVDVTLPGDAAFHVDASNSSGTIYIGFPGVTETYLNPNRREAHGDIGNPPRARVILSSRTGPINLHA